MLTLGEQLLLIALDATKGAIRGMAIIKYGLNAAGLAELLERERISLRRPDGSFGVTVTSGSSGASGASGNGWQPMDDPLLELVWKRAESMPDGQDHPDLCVKNWTEPSLHAYLLRLRSREVITWDKPKVKKTRYGRFRLLDTEAAAAARAAVDRVRTGADPSARDQDLAGIVGALGYGAVLYHGPLGRSKRAALASAIEKQRFAIILARTLPPPAPGQKFVFDSSNDLQMAKSMMNAVTFDVFHAGGFGGHHGG